MVENYKDFSIEMFGSDEIMYLVTSMSFTFSSHQNVIEVELNDEYNDVCKRVEVTLSDNAVINFNSEEVADAINKMLAENNAAFNPNYVIQEIEYLRRDIENKSIISTQFIDDYDFEITAFIQANHDHKANFKTEMPLSNREYMNVNFKTGEICFNLSPRHNLKFRDKPLFMSKLQAKINEFVKLEIQNVDKT